jgi:hypothetical protein
VRRATGDVCDELVIGCNVPMCLTTALHWWYDPSKAFSVVLTLRCNEASFVFYYYPHGKTWNRVQ